MVEEKGPNSNKDAVKYQLKNEEKSLLFYICVHKWNV